jgi:hypothetical protein
VSGHGKRETTSQANAIVWRDRVIDDVLRGKGRASARAREISIDLVIAGAELIAAYMAAGETEISLTDLKQSGVRSVPLIACDRCSGSSSISSPVVISNAPPIAISSGLLEPMRFH